VFTGSQPKNTLIYTVQDVKLEDLSGNKEGISAF